MTKKIRKISIQILVFCFFIFLTACGGGGNDEEIIDDINYRDTGEISIDLSGNQYSGYPRANGFLFGISLVGPDDKWITPLAPPAFRFTEHNDLYNRIKSWDAQSQLIVAGSYDHPPWKSRPRPGENDDYTLWENIVTDLVNDNIFNGRSGEEVQYDIWNEGDFPQFWDGTREKHNETWVRGAKIVRNLDPEAEIVGPSFAVYDLDGITDFLLFAESEGVLPDIVSWHENHTRPGSIQSHIEEYRQSPNALVSRIHINEYGFTNETFIPGRIIHFLANLDRSQVEIAMRGCWAECHDDITLSGLLTDNLLPTPAWWVHKYYADVAAEGNTMISISPIGDIDGLVSINPNNEVSILIGNKGGNNLNVPISLDKVSETLGFIPSVMKVIRINEGRSAMSEPVPEIATFKISGNGLDFEIKMLARSAVFITIK